MRTGRAQVDTVTAVGGDEVVVRRARGQSGDRRGGDRGGARAGVLVAGDDRDDLRGVARDRAARVVEREGHRAGGRGARGAGHRGRVARRGAVRARGHRRGDAGGLLGDCGDSEALRC